MRNKKKYFHELEFLKKESNYFRHVKKFLRYELWLAQNQNQAEKKEIFFKNIFFFLCLKEIFSNFRIHFFQTQILKKIVRRFRFMSFAKLDTNEEIIDVLEEGKLRNPFSKTTIQDPFHEALNIRLAKSFDDDDDFDDDEDFDDDLDDDDDLEEEDDVSVDEKELEEKFYEEDFDFDEDDLDEDDLDEDLDDEVL